ncbi:MAG TPA: response regulator [Polyangiaceae bacterium]
MANRGIQVLVVDDEPAVVDALGQLLSDEGFEVRTADNGRAALVEIEENTPDVIVTDLTMTEMDGLTLLKELRGRKVDAPVIVATAVSDVGPAVAAVRAGAAEYLTKPIDFDRLLIAIEGALQARNVDREATALRAHNEALLAEAERNLRAREEFLSIVAHDIRGPLSTILQVTRLPEGADGLEIAHKLAIVERASQTAIRLVDDLLDAARIQMGGLVLELGSHRASLLLHDVVTRLEPTATRSGVHLDVSIDEDFALCCAFERIVQVLSNLASNAIHVTEPGRHVRLTAELHDELALFTVEDQGPGIAPELIPHLFERGVHSDRGKHRGTGLGLTIAKGIVEAHAGGIRVESTLGTGTSFYVELPLCGPERISWQVAPTNSEGAASAPYPQARGVVDVVIRRARKVQRSTSVAAMPSQCDSDEPSGL